MVKWVILCSSSILQKQSAGRLNEGRTRSLALAMIATLAKQTKKPPVPPMRRTFWENSISLSAFHEHTFADNTAFT